MSSMRIISARTGSAASVPGLTNQGANFVVATHARPKLLPSASVLSPYSALPSVRRPYDTTGKYVRGVDLHLPSSRRLGSVGRKPGV